MALAGVLLAGLALALVHLLQGPAGFAPGDVLRALVAPGDDLTSAVVQHVRLPRLGLALVCGAALGLAGALMQTATRNPFASPATLGVNAGAYLALVVVGVVAPSVLAGWGWWVAIGGGAVAANLAIVMAGGARAAPARLALAGMAVALAAAAATAAMQVVFEQETQGLFLWGAGSLLRADGAAFAFASPRVGVAVLAALALARSLDLLRLDDDVARGLGARVGLIRLAAGALAVVLAAVAVAVAGPIGFVGLLAPHLVRLAGVRRHAVALPATLVVGGLVLVGADVLARLLPAGATPVPVGAVTALLGAPALIVLARRHRSGGDPRGAGSGPVAAARSAGPLLVGLALALLATVAVGSVVGAADVGWSDLGAILAGGGEATVREVVVDLRWPRMAVAALVGAALAVGGVLLQAVVRNPLAAPEVVGTTSGAAFAALSFLLLVPSAPASIVPVAAFVGGVISFAIVYVAAWRGGVAPLRLALVGLAASAFLAALVQMLVVGAGLRVASAITWLAGSTYARGWSDVASLWPWLALLALPVALSARRLDLLALGDDLPRSLGLPLERARFGWLALSVALTAAAVATVGSLSFVGLMAPHLSRAWVGQRHVRVLPVAALLGALLVTTADVIGRSLFAPRELPSGLVTALVGAAVFAWMLVRGRSRAPVPSGRRSILQGGRVAGRER